MMTTLGANDEKRTLEIRKTTNASIRIEFITRMSSFHSVQLAMAKRSICMAEHVAAAADKYNPPPCHPKDEKWEQGRDRMKCAKTFKKEKKMAVTRTKFFFYPFILPSLLRGSGKDSLQKAKVAFLPLTTLSAIFDGDQMQALCYDPKI